MVNKTENRVLVTGATGTAGSELVKQLSYSNVILRCGVRSDKFIDMIRKISKELGFVDLDYEKPVSLGNACINSVKIWYR